MNPSQLEYLQAMGVDVYVRRDVERPVTPEPSPETESFAAEPAPIESSSAPTELVVAETSAPEPVVSGEPEPPPETPEPPTTAEITAPPGMFDEEPPPPDSYYAPSMSLDDHDVIDQPLEEKAPDPVASMNWETLRETVATCEKCELHGTRTQTVFGVGHPNARVMVIGEAPGRDEDLQGEPFVGRAGKLLDLMLKAAGFDRKDVFIANILKCRPPNNRDPKAEEALACRAYLERQIALVQPEVILSVGRVSAQNLLDSKESIGRMRGKQHQIPNRNSPVHVTYHPAYLLRQPSEKRKVWADLQQMLDTLDSGSTEN